LHSLDHVRDEPKSKVQPKQGHIEETNTDPDQGMPLYITPQSLTFTLKHYLYVQIDCTLAL
jgi:hypothetical protein